MGYQPFVYGLYDPADAGHIRYVGMAPSRASRPYDHVRRARKNLTDCSYLVNWIRKIQLEGREPSVLVLEQLAHCSGRKFLGFVESCYIKALRQIGHKLTNENDGGWGGSNGPHSDKTRAKMRASWTPEIKARVGAASRARRIGQKASEETRAKMSEARRARQIAEQQKVRVSIARKAAWDNATPEERALHAARVSEAMKGKGHPQTEESRLKISQALKGRIMSEEWRAKNAAAQRGKTQSDETKAKRSASLKASWARRKAEHGKE